jgi:kinetochore protein Mis12/MTW1
VGIARGRVTYGTPELPKLLGVDRVTSREHLPTYPEITIINAPGQLQQTFNKQMAYAQASSILTEHLGYAPISLIDDIINAVNDILYKCTAAMENFLASRYGNDERIPENEIEHGTAKLEMLLESVVDKSFDKFELYVLRNLLTIPADLLSGGWIRLKHHQGVDFTESNSSIDDQIAALEREIYIQQRLNSVLNRQLQFKHQLLEQVNIMQKNTDFLSPKSNDSLSAVHPLSRLVSGLSSQAKDAVSTITSSENALESTPFKPYLDILPRDVYINTFAYRAIQEQQISSTVQGPRVGDPENLASIARLVRTAGQ